MSYYRFADLSMDSRMPSGYDRTRNTEIGVKQITLKHLEEAFTSEHWLVRIYRVKKQPNLLPLQRLRKRQIARASRKTISDRRGVVSARSRVVKGKRFVKSK